MSIIITEQNEESLDSKDVCLIFDDIDENMSNYVVSFLLEREYKNKKPEFVKIFINSCGGGVNNSFAIIDVMNSVSFPVHTYGIGEVYSAALFIFMSGAQGNRFLLPNTSILSHQWSGSNEGKKHEIEATEKENKLISKRILKHYEKCTGLSLEEINKNLLPTSDVYLTAKEAINFGLADKIIKKL